MVPNERGDGMSRVMGTMDRVEEDVFLTPRVVDQGAFERFSETLRGLVREAAGQGKALLTTTTEVKDLGQQLRDATKELQTRVETAVKVAPALEQRVAKAEQLFERLATELAAREKGIREVASGAVVVDAARIRAQVEKEIAGAVGRLIESAVAKHLERIDQRAAELANAADERERAMSESIARAESLLTRITEISRGLETRATELAVESESKLREAEQRCEHAARSAVEAAEARVKQHFSRLDACAEGKVAETQTRVAGVAGPAEERVRSLMFEAEQRACGGVERVEEAIVSGTERALTRADEVAREAEARLEALSERAEHRLNELLATVPDKLACIDERARLVASELDRRLALVTQCADAAGRTAEEAKAMLDPARVRAEAEGVLISVREDHQQALAKSLETMRQAVERIDELLPRAETAVTRLSDFRAQAELARTQLAEAILHGASRLEAWESKWADFTRAQEEHAADIGAKLSASLAKAAEIDETIRARGELHRESLEAAARPVMQELSVQARAVGEWLQDLLRQGTEIGRALELTARRAGQGRELGIESKCEAA